MTRSITIEDLYQMQFVSRPRMSPDGRRVAFVVTTIDAHTQNYRSAIWLAPTEGGEARCFTSGPANAGDPSWSPDGRWLAFVSEREGEVRGKDGKKLRSAGKGKPQIWLIALDGGEARQLTFMEHGASSPVWSPDSKYLLYTAPVGPADEESEDGKKLPKARVIDRLWYRLDGVGFIHERRSHLFLIEAAALNQPERVPVQLTDGDWDDSSPAWSPDGGQIVFTSNHAQDRWRFPGADLYTLSMHEGKPGSLQRLTDETLSCAAPSWSPDGSTIAFLAASKKNSANHVYLYTLPSTASAAAATNLTSHFEGSFADWTNSDIGDEHLMPAPIWSADGKMIYALASHRGASRVFTIPASGIAPGEQPGTLTPGEVHVRDFTGDASHTALALLIGDPVRPQEIFTCSVSASSEVQRVTAFHDALFHDVHLARPEYMPYEGADGWPIDGWLLKPQDFDPAGTYPLIVEIHGGPQTQYGYGFFHEMQVLAAQGYVVLYTNPRGSCGYGYDFAHAVDGAWGEKDSIDILNGVDVLVKRGYIDEQRIGVTGGSYGGFMTNWLVGHDQRFKAAVTDRCVSNLASMFGSSDIGWDLAFENFNDVAPWEDLNRYMHMSPITYVGAIHTPLLILHSENDLRCNIEQAEQLFAALTWMGRETLFVRFEDQSHGLSRGGHPRLRLERLHHILNWFKKYM